MINSTDFNKDKIVEFFQNLAPIGPVELVKVVNDTKSITTAITDLVERINAPRQLKLLTEETAQTQLAVRTLSEAVEKIAVLNHEFQVLNQKKVELENQKAIISDIEAQQLAIERLQKFIEQHDLKQLKLTLQENVQVASPQLQEFQDWLKKIDSHLEWMQGEFLAEAKQLLTRISRRWAVLEDDLENSAGDVDNENLKLSKLLAAFNNDLSEQVAVHNNLFKQLTEIKSQLLEVKERHLRNIQTYETHFAQNKEIWGELGKKNQLETHLEKLIERTEQDLRAFDQEIKTLVLKTDNLVFF